MVFLQSLAIVFDLDRLTTISWCTPLTLFLAAAVASVSGLLAIRTPQSMVKFKSPKICFMTRVVFILCMILVAFYLTCQLAGLLAQHADGENQRFTAVIANVQPNYSTRNPCEIRISAVANKTEDVVRFCMKTTTGTRMSINDFQPGDRVELVVRVTPFGTAVISVDRV
jgi:hypothetical protein